MALWFIMLFKRGLLSRDRIEDYAGFMSAIAVAGIRWMKLDCNPISRQAA